MHRVIKNLYFINSISMRAVTLRNEEEESERDKSVRTVTPRNDEEESERDKSVRSNCTIMSSLHS